ASVSRKMQSSLQSWLVFPNPRYEILRPDAEPGELPASLGPSPCPISDEKTSWRGHDRRTQLRKAVRTRSLDRPAPPNPPLPFFLVQVSKFPRRHPIRTLRHLDGSA